VHAYVIVSGAVRVSTVDADQQEVVVDEPVKGEFFDFASMLDKRRIRRPLLSLKKPADIDPTLNSVCCLEQVALCVPGKP
jgi:CRP/FNR family cyclic AMP-dependent transcriptional regulator